MHSVQVGASDAAGANQEESILVREEAARISAVTTWSVEEFDDWTLRGVVASSDGRRLPFHSVSFQADSCFRWPRVGEAVEVVFNASNELLSVHGK